LEYIIFLPGVEPSSVDDAVSDFVAFLHHQPYGVRYLVFSSPAWFKLFYYAEDDWLEEVYSDYRVVAWRLFRFLDYVYQISSFIEFCYPESRWILDFFQENVSIVFPILELV